MNDSTGRHRKKFKAGSLVEAVEKAAHHFFGSKGINPASHITISDCFLEWRKRLSCREATIKRLSQNLTRRNRRCQINADASGIKPNKFLQFLSYRTRMARHF
ncbi:MAG: hypothetical protein H6752_14710 [Candidatus Omnitrophica bacterium]|nr:hypothetical protein [Candidatus Omnitrophota bacterium]